MIDHREKLDEYKTLMDLAARRLFDRQQEIDPPSTLKAALRLSGMDQEYIDEVTGIQITPSFRDDHRCMDWLLYSRKDLITKRLILEREISCLDEFATDARGIINLHLAEQRPKLLDVLDMKEEFRRPEGNEVNAVVLRGGFLGWSRCESTEEQIPKALLWSYTPEASAHNPPLVHFYIETEELLNKAYLSLPYDEGNEETILQKLRA